MTTSINNTALINQLNQPSASAQKTQNKKDEIGQNEFLQLLITQLKNQDPMDPLKNDQFAVDMAQFSQVEQLIKINDKLDNENGSDVGSLAGYLGREVVLNKDTVAVEGGEGGRLQVALAGDASRLEIQLLNKDGSVKETIQTGAVSKGKHSVVLNDLQATEGEYGYRVRAVDAAGRDVEVSARVAGVVSGFIPGPEAKLLVGPREISPAEVLEVGVA